MKAGKLTLLSSICFCLLTLYPTLNVQAQHISFSYNYKLDLSEASEPPILTAAPDSGFPEDARKNNVEGTVKLNCVLSANSQVTDINVEQGLPNGVTEAVVAGVKKLNFKPAKRDGKTVSVKMMLDYTVTMAFDENDPSVKKPVITNKPPPIYPESKRADKVKGKVSVQVLFNADGTSKLLGVGSVLPKEFDKAAAEAAKNIKFQPATQKKAKNL